MSTPHCSPQRTDFDAENYDRTPHRTHQDTIPTRCHPCHTNHTRSPGIDRQELIVKVCPLMCVHVERVNVNPMHWLFIILCFFVVASHIKTANVKCYSHFLNLTAHEKKPRKIRTYWINFPHSPLLPLLACLLDFEKQLVVNHPTIQ